MQAKLTLNLTLVDLATVIMDALNMSQPAAEAKAVTMYKFLDPTLELFWGDAVQLQQVIGNLLSNVLASSPVGGRVDVKLKRYEFLIVNSESADLTVQDTFLQDTFLKDQRQKTLKRQHLQCFVQAMICGTSGSIGPDLLTDVFSHFHQQNGASTHKVNKLGLELAIAKQVVELHGGTIWAGSAEVGQGKTFMIRFPLSKKTVSVQ